MNPRKKDKLDFRINSIPFCPFGPSLPGSPFAPGGPIHNKLMVKQILISI